MSRASIQAWFETLPGNTRGALFMILASGLYSTMAAFIKLTGAHLPVIQILLVRQILMALIVSPAVFRGFPGSLRTHNLGLQFLRVAAALIAMLCGFSALVHLPLANATAIAFSKSFFTTIFAIFFLHEVVGRRRWAAVAAGFLGVLIVSRPGASDFSYYSMLAIIGAAAAGLVMVVIRRMSRTDAPITILTYQAFLVGLAVAIPGIYYWRAPTATEWLILFCIGITGYCGQMMNIMAYKNGEASVMAIFDYLRLIFAVILGFYIFGELPDVFTWSGALIVVAAALYTVRRNRRVALPAQDIHTRHE